jgi:hypothetical protein
MSPAPAVGDLLYDSALQGVPVNIIDGASGLATDITDLDAAIDALKTSVDALEAVVSGPSTAIYSGTHTAPVNAGTATILTTTQACKAVRLQAPIGNSQTVLYGSAVGTCTMELVAGEVSDEIAVSNVNLIFVKSKGDATQTVNWLARN